MNSVHLNSIGLLVDFVGAILIYKFGFPFTDVFPDNGIGLNLFEVDPERQKRINRCKIMARLGFAMLAMGFIIQWMSNYLYR